METLLLWLALALLACVLAGIAWTDWPYLSRPLVRVEGRVIGHTQQDDEGSPSYAPIFEFKDQHSGQTLTGRDDYYGATPRPPVGNPVTLVYPAGMPAKARIRRPLARGLIYTLLTTGVVLIVLKLMGHIP